jgi:glycine cleavage system H protein
MAENLQYPVDLKYTKDHEWARKEGGTATCGISAFATAQLGDIVYVELPEVGAELTKGQSLGVVESTKAVSEVYAPVSGKVVARNEALIDAPDSLNADPYAKGWMVKVELANPAELDALMDHPAYLKHLAESGH